MSVFFRELTSPQIKAAAKADALLLLPLGQTEEHGNHLPVGTDTIIAERVCVETARRLEDEIPTFVLPPIDYGYSGQIMTRWPGTFTLPTRLVVELLVEVCKSVSRMGFKRIVIVNAHGPHKGLAITAAREVTDATETAVAVLMPNDLIADEFNAIRKSPLGGACHGCEYETSLIMHFGYDVDLDLTDSRDVLKPSSSFCSTDLFGGGGKVFWSTWYRQPSRSGVYGDPTVASAETGRKAFEAIIQKMIAFCREFCGHAS